MALLLNTNDVVTRSYSYNYPSPTHNREVKGVGDRTGNLAEAVDGSVTSNGITFIKQQGNISVIGTATASGGRLGFVINLGIILKPGVYTLSSNNNDPNLSLHMSDKLTSSAILSLNGNEQSKQITITETITVIIGFNVVGGKIYNDTNINVMLNEGSTPLPYEPYGVKIPVVSRGKNLFDKDANDTNNGYINNAYINGNGVQVDDNRYYVSEFIRISPSKQYTISIAPDCPADESHNAPSIAWYDLDKKFISANGYNGLRKLISKTFTAPVNAFYCKISVYTKLNSYDYFQLELGDTATEYTPYRPPIISTQYLPTPLMANERLTPTAREVKFKKVDFSQLTWNKDTSYSKIRWFTEVGVYPSSSAWSEYNKDVISNAYTTNVKAVSDLTNAPDKCLAVFFNGNIYLVDSDLNNHTSKEVADLLKGRYAYIPLITPTTEPVTTTPIGTLRNEEKTIRGATTIITTDTKVLPTQIEVSYKSNKADYVVVNFATTDGNIFTTTDGDTYTIKMRKSQYDTMMTNELLNLLEVM